ncbi:MAG: SGNH/GDSL hydrolase family protein [Chitinophagaceae bacterium]
MKKSFQHLIILVVFIFIYCAQGYTQDLSKTTDLRIACVGNSITAGARVTDPSQYGYPAILSDLLQSGGYQKCLVRNFGIGGATVLKFGTPNIWRVLDSLKLFVPDIVIIEVGTNETVGEPRRNWEHIDAFETDYQEYINRLRVINPACRIILCSPPDMVLTTPNLPADRVANLTERRPRIWELRERIRTLSKAEGIYFLDLSKAFRGRPDLMTPMDGVHPNQAGYAFLAEQVFHLLKKKRLIRQQI